MAASREALRLERERADGVMIFATWFRLDLRNGPLVLEVPPKVRGLADDIWYNWCATSGSPARTAATAENA